MDQHFVPWTDAGGDQGKVQSRRTGVDANRMGDAEIVGYCHFEPLNERAKAKRAVLEQRANIGQRVGLDLSPLK